MYINLFYRVYRVLQGVQVIGLSYLYRNLDIV